MLEALFFGPWIISSAKSHHALKHFIISMDFKMHLTKLEVEILTQASTKINAMSCFGCSQKYVETHKTL